MQNLAGNCNGMLGMPAMMGMPTASLGAAGQARRMQNMSAQQPYANYSQNRIDSISGFMVEPKKPDEPKKKKIPPVDFDLYQSNPFTGRKKPAIECLKDHLNGWANL